MHYYFKFIILVVKYGRKTRDQSSIADRMSKLTIHSMIKKSTRLSMKLSNVLGVSVGIVDEEFDKLENKFIFYEKLIKSFGKDSLHHLTSLKVNTNGIKLSKLIMKTKN